MVDKKITDLNELTTPTSSDVLAIVDDPSGSPETKKITAANLFTNVTDPTNNQDAATKKYVDDNIPANVFLFFTENSSDLGGVYLDMEVDPVTDGEENTLTVIPADSTGTLMASYATQLNDGVIDGIVELPIGVYGFHVHCEASSADKLSMYAEVYHRNAGGTETLLFTSEDSNLISITKGSIAFHGSLTTDKEWIAGDRIVIKLYGKNNSAASRNLTIYVEGDTASRAELPAIRGTSVGGAPAGSDGDIQFNDSGSFGADSNLYWSVARNELNTNTIQTISDGTQALPALKFNDTNTGFYKSGDSIRTSINNSTITTVNATGLDMNTHKIVGVVDPTANQEAATKKYVDDNITPHTPEGTAVKSTGEGGGTKFLREDGDNTCSWQAAGGAAAPAGSIIMYGAAAAPAGWVLCNGASLLRAGTYASLFSVIGTTFGTADGTHFNVPDMRGIFPRGVGVNGTLSDANGIGFTGVLGTYQNDKFQGHKHELLGNLVSGGGGDVGFIFGGRISSWSPDTNGPITDATHGTNRHGDETNPANLGLTYIIKY